MSLLPVSSARVCRPRRNLFPINFSIQLFPAAFSEFFENSVWEQSVWTVPRVHNLNLNNLLVLYLTFTNFFYAPPKRGFTELSVGLTLAWCP